MSVLGLAVKAAKKAAAVAEPMARADREAALAVAMAQSKVRDPEGNLMRVYHGTPGVFDKFRKRTGDIGIHFGTAGQANDRLAYTAPKFPNVHEARTGKPYQPNVIPAYLDLRNPIRLEDAGAWNKDNLEYQLRDKFPEDIKRISQLKTTRDIRNFLRQRGHDGVVYKNTGEVENSQPLLEARSAASKAAFEAQRARGKPGNAFDAEDRLTPEYLAMAEANKAYDSFVAQNAKDSYIAFEPTQIKSPFNQGTFSVKDPDILKARGGHISTLAVKRKAKK